MVGRLPAESLLLGSTDCSSQALWAGPLVAIFLCLEVVKIRGRVFTQLQL